MQESHGLYFATFITFITHTCTREAKQRISLFTKKSTCKETSAKGGLKEIIDQTPIPLGIGFTGLKN